MYSNATWRSRRSRSASGWIKRNSETGNGLVPEVMMRCASKVNVGGSERTGFRLAESGQPEKFQKVGAVLRVRVERLRPHVGNDRFELLEGRSQSDRFFPLRGAQMRSRRSRHDSVAHRRARKVLSGRRCGDCAKRSRSGSATARIAFARLDLRDLSQPAGRPVGFDSPTMKRFALDRFRLLMPNCLQIAVAKCVERQLALRAINLPLFVAEVRELTPGQCRIGRFQAAFDLLALNPDASIIDPV